MSRTIRATRDDVRRLLAAHAALPLEDHERAMTNETLRFVTEEPRCAERTLAIGHLTGSAWIVDSARTRTLLTPHRKLGKWLQLGGHADGDLDLFAVALREAAEESGLTQLRPVSGALFDVDRHWIPARRAESAHWHYDLRFLIEADPAEPLVRSDESHDLAWVEIARMSDYNPEESMLRMARKTQAGRDAPAESVRRLLWCSPKRDKIPASHPARLTVGEREAPPPEERMIDERDRAGGELAGLLFSGHVGRQRTQRDGFPDQDGARVRGRSVPLQTQGRGEGEKQRERHHHAGQPAASAEAAVVPAQQDQDAGAGQQRDRGEKGALPLRG